ncbi:MAG: hypothetical protein U1D69_12040, partial [Polynucleobacter sp.]|nr:hypothetical protein [Polynucleobacter sp.]
HTGAAVPEAEPHSLKHYRASLIPNNLGRFGEHGFTHSPTRMKISRRPTNNLIFSLAMVVLVPVLFPSAAKLLEPFNGLRLQAGREPAGKAAVHPLESE